MKITIDRETLAKALSEVVPFIDLKNPMMVLKNIKVTTKGDRVKFEACNSQSSVKKYVTAQEIDQDGEFVVSSDLEKYVAKLRCPSVTLDADENLLCVIHPKGKGEFPTIPASDYPMMKYPTEDTTDITIPTTLLADCIAMGKNFVAKDKIRPQISAIHAYVKDGEFGFCATDTHVLIHDKTHVGLPEDTDISWYVEPVVFPTLAMQCRKAENVTLRINPQSVMYRFGDTIIQTLQSKGAYPNFRRVIPQDYSIEASVDRRDLTESLNRIAMMSNQASRLVKVSFNMLDVNISTSDLDTMKSSSESLSHNGCNGDITIGFNIDYFLTCVAASETDNVCMRMTDASRPAVFVRDDKPDFRIVLMPLTLQ